MAFRASDCVTRIRDVRGCSVTEHSYVSAPCICPYGMHSDNFTFTEYKETAGCKDMLFICFVYILHVNFCHKTKGIMVVVIFCHLRTGSSVMRRKALHNCVVGH